MTKIENYDLLALAEQFGIDLEGVDPERLADYEQVLLSDKGQQEFIRSRMKRRFYEKVAPLIETADVVFDLLETVGLQYALIRHLGILFTIFDHNLMDILEGFDENNKINDVDILIEFDRKKIDEFVKMLRSLPGIEGQIIVDFATDENRYINAYGFSSDAFIKFKLKGYKFEVFANFGTREEEDNPREVFAAIDANGDPVAETGNYIAKVIFGDHGVTKPKLPCLYGEGIVKSYLQQSEVLRLQSYNDNLGQKGDKSYYLRLRRAIAEMLNQILVD